MSNDDPLVACICPFCKAAHEVRMFWTGNGVPRIYCKLCQKRVGRESRGNAVKRRSKVGPHTGNN
jgi:Zn ribbon nucleic-acid-binding protein